MVTAVNSEQQPSGAYIVWDVCEIANAHAEYLCEEDPDLDEDEARDRAFSDEDLFHHEWDYVLESLTDIMGRINEGGEWYCEGANMGWMHRSGHQSFCATTGEELLRKILPDTECTFSIYVKDDDGRGKPYLYIENSHHDAIGELYYVYIGDGPPDSDEDESE